MSIGTGIITLLLGASVDGMTMFYSYFSSPLILLLNILPPVLLTLILYYAAGRAWLGFAVPALLLFILAIISYFKMQIRNEPLVFSDYQLAGEAGNVMAGYDLVVDWRIWAAAAYLAAGAVTSFLLLRHKPRIRTRVIGAVSAALACALFYSFLFTNDQVYDKAAGSAAITSRSDAVSYIGRGFTYPFIRSFQPRASQQPPPDFEPEEASTAAATYQDDIIPDGEKVNIVSVMLESYADFTGYDSIDFNADVYGPLHDLEKESVSGSLVVNSFAGGTINTERSFLTGFTSLGDFMAPSNSYVRYFESQGYYTEGYHAGDSWFYERNVVNPNLGFDNYYFLEDIENSNRWDDSFFSTVLSLYENRDPDVPYFSYNLSYQNHGPYDSMATTETAYIKKGSLSDESYNILNNYFEGISNTTRHVAGLIDSFRTRSEPVIVVFFGDHKPWLGNDNAVYRELGINIDQSTEQGFFNFYTTPYVIWANDAAKAALGNDFTGDGGDFSPCFLMNKLFELCAWGGNGYMKAADGIRDYTSVINSSTGGFFEDGTLTDKLSAEADIVYKNFKKIEYYWQTNFMN